MASSLACSNPCEPVRRRLYELLEQPQEPFLMEAYLLENGCSGRIIRSHSSPFCWPLNAAGMKLRKFGSHGGIRRSRAASFLRRALLKLVYSKAFRKVLQLDNKTNSKKSSAIFDFLSPDCKDQQQQLSPVSVLGLHHSDDTSLFDKQNECPLPSRESSITLKETQAKSLSRKKAKFSCRRRRLLLDWLWEAEEESIWSFHGCLDEATHSWESEKGAVREESKRFRPEAGELGLFLEAAILDDLKEETILHMLSYNFH